MSQDVREPVVHANIPQSRQFLRDFVGRTIQRRLGPRSAARMMDASRPALTHIGGMRALQRRRLKHNVVKAPEPPAG